MCKAHVLRFRCGHGTLMGFEPCRLGPCPVIRSTGVGLPQQPYRCYNCQHKAEALALRPISSRHSSSTSSIESLDSDGSSASSPSYSVDASAHRISHPLPGVAVQPRGSVSVRPTRPQSMCLSSSFITPPSKMFNFSCHGSDHFVPPHYADLPGFLPHQDHPCPPCQLEDFRMQADAEVARCAQQQFPSLKAEMLVHDGRTWDPETMTKPTMEQYVEEKRTEEREMWVHVTRKWTQDLKKMKVLVAEEDGLGLFA